MLRSHTNARVLMAKMRWWDHLSNEALWLHYSTVCGVEDSAGEGEKTEAAVVWASGGMKTTQ